MEAFQIPGIFGNNICRAKPINENKYIITMNSIPVGSIVKEGNGWRIEEQIKEELSAENVQLIGTFINKRKW